SGGGRPRPGRGVSRPHRARHSGGSSWSSSSWASSTDGPGPGREPAGQPARRRPAAVRARPGKGPGPGGAAVPTAPQVMKIIPPRYRDLHRGAAVKQEVTSSEMGLVCGGWSPHLGYTPPPVSTIEPWWPGHSLDSHRDDEEAFGAPRPLESRGTGRYNL